MWICHLKLIRQGMNANKGTRYDFQEAYAFAQTMEHFNVAGLAKGKGSEKGIVDASYCKSSVWFALPRDERKKILAARDKDGKGSKNGWERNGEGEMVRRGNGKGSGSSIGDGKSKRKLVALASE
jgi:hypothetical protein